MRLIWFDRRELGAPSITWAGPRNLGCLGVKFRKDGREHEDPCHCFCSIRACDDAYRNARYEQQSQKRLFQQTYLCTACAFMSPHGRRGHLLMLNWLKRRTQLAGLRAATEDIERYLAYLRGGSPSELGMLVAIATILRMNLRREGSLPDALFDFGPDAPDDIQIAALLGMPKLIRVFQKEGQLSDASRLMLWFHTARALVLYPELRNHARAMWREVIRGFDCAEEALNDIGNVTGEPVPREAYEMFSFVPPALNLSDA